MQSVVRSELEDVTNILLLPPLDYLPLVHLMRHAILLVFAVSMLVGERLRDRLYGEAIRLGEEIEENLLSTSPPLKKSAKWKRYRRVVCFAQAKVETLGFRLARDCESLKTIGCFGQSRLSARLFQLMSELQLRYSIQD